MYFNKYIKYNPVGESPSIILLDGTSSSGKTTIGKLFEQHDYKHIISDDFCLPSIISVNRTLSNSYIDQKHRHQLISLELRRLVYLESKKYDKVVIDDISQKILRFFDRDVIYIIVMYASLDDLINNMISRQLTDPRSIFIFTQYAKRYVATYSDGLDIINRKKFIKQLKKIKCEFESKAALIKFATNVFASMNIHDDDDHNVKLRDGYQYDYIVHTHEKTPDEIYTEIQGRIDNLN